MNKKGFTTVFYTFMLALTIIVLALALSGPIKETVDNARNESYEGYYGLNCSSTTISDYDKATCVVADMSIFYFIGGLIFVAGMIIVARLVFSS